MLTRMKNRVQGGFTLIELMIVVAIIGILAAVAIPAFVKYMRKSKTVEAIEALDKIKAGAKSYYAADHYDSSGNILPKQFPGSATIAPAAKCCTQTGTKCAVSNLWETNASWKALQFAIADPNYFQYNFTDGGSQGTAATFTTDGYADLDCDNTMSTYELQGKVNTESEVVIAGPIITNEIE